MVRRWDDAWEEEVVPDVLVEEEDDADAVGDDDAVDVAFDSQLPQRPEPEREFVEYQIWFEG